GGPSQPHPHRSVITTSGPSVSADRRKQWIPLLVFIVGVVACLPSGGDPGYSVRVTNATSATVVFFVDDVGAAPGTLAADGWRLQPGADAVDHWTIPSGASDGRRPTVRAMDTNGAVVFCRRLSAHGRAGCHAPSTHAPAARWTGAGDGRASGS